MLWRDWLVFIGDSTGIQVNERFHPEFSSANEKGDRFSEAVIKFISLSLNGRGVG